MTNSTLGRRALAWVAGFAILLFSGWASADPPSRVARLGYTAGEVSFSPAGEGDWVGATVNRPLIPGDRLWTERSARAEVQVGGAMIRLGADTGVALLDLDDRIVQLQLTQGVLGVRVRRLDPGQSFEIDTPHLAFSLRRPGDYRIEVDPDGDATTVVVRDGGGEVFGDGAAYELGARQAYRFVGIGLRDAQALDLPRVDDFDRWASERDSRWERSVSARYVSPEVIGYQDLDAYGSWRVDAAYGHVWMPSRVAVGWAPYRDGHWAWVDPWGWTWIDDAPWGFAVSHYGRWAHVRGHWVWVPGPVRTRAYYAPALVVFLGGDNFQLTISSGSIGGVAWFPLAPREVYRPSYPVSRDYFTSINRSNTVIDVTVINNYYEHSNLFDDRHANRRVPGAVVAVPANAFAQSRPVSRTAIRIAQDRSIAGPVSAVPAVAPTPSAVRGAAAERGKPPARVFDRPVIARHAPPAPRAGFVAQEPQLAAQRGKPLDEAARKDLRPERPTPAPVVKLVPPPQEAPRALPPRPQPVAPRAAPEAVPADTRARAVDRPAAPAKAGAPGRPAERQAAPGARPGPAPVARPNEPKAAPAKPETAGPKNGKKAREQDERKERERGASAPGRGPERP